MSKRTSYHAPTVPGAPSYPPGSIVPISLSNPAAAPAPLPSPGEIEPPSRRREPGDSEGVKWITDGSTAAERRSSLAARQEATVGPGRGRGAAPPVVQQHQQSPHSYPVVVIPPTTSPVPIYNQTNAVVDAQVAYHNELVRYYYDYAMKGLVAPVTDERQDAARRDALELARRNGVVLTGVPGEREGVPGYAGPFDGRQYPAPQVSYASQPPVPTPSPSHVQHPQSYPQQYPAAPVQYQQTPVSHFPPHPQAVWHAAPAPQQQQYAITAPVAQPQPPPRVLPTPPPRSFDPAPSNPLTRSTSLANSPSRAIKQPAEDSNIPRSMSAAIPEKTIFRPASVPINGSVAVGKRPLPVPPPQGAAVVAVAQRSRPLPMPAPHQAARGVVVNGGPGARPLVGTKTAEELLRDKMMGLAMDPTPLPTPPPQSPVRNHPPAPTFAFTTDDDPSPPIIRIGSPGPSFSITSSSPPRFVPTVSAPPTGPALHPRFDPSHPSHYLYHPMSTSLSIAAGAVACRGCKQAIYGKVLIAMGGHWHPDCFRCAKDGCGTLLDHISFDGDDEGVYCSLHYEEVRPVPSPSSRIFPHALPLLLQLFAKKCHHCSTPIVGSEFVTVSDPDLLPPTNRTYHALHFFCSSCGDPFVDPSSLSKGRAGTIAMVFVVHKGWPYCPPCDTRLWKERCRGCGEGLGGDFLTALGGNWHEECFGCFVRLLSTLFSNGGGTDEGW